MIRKLLSRIRYEINRPLLEKVDAINKNLNFLVNQTLSFDQVKTLPSVRHIQEKQMDILQKLAVFFEKHQIRYFLSYGTLLGAVRHHGFVPWDDDVDLGVFREDFYKIIAHEEDLEEFGIHFSCPFSKSGYFTARGWHKFYDAEKKYHVSIFNFDLVNTPDIKNFLKIRTAYNKTAIRHRIKYEKGSYSLQQLKDKLDQLNNRYFKEADFVTIDKAGQNTFIVKNICASMHVDFTRFSYIFPLQKQEFIFANDQEVKRFPIPNNPKGVLEDFYSKDFMHFPTDLYPKHVKKKI